MRHSISALAAVAFALFATACTETATQLPAGTATQLPVSNRTGSATDESACLRAVSQQTANGDVIVVSSSFSQANTEVIVGVGPAPRANWRCLVSNGIVAEVMSLVDEGAL